MLYITRPARARLLGLLWVGLLLAPLPLLAEENAVAPIEEAFSYQAAKGAQGDLEAYQGLHSTQLERYHEYKMEQERNKLYDVGILSLVALSSLLFVLYVIKSKAGYSSETVVNVTGLIFIVYGTIVLTLMVDTEQQLTAAMGILGAVAGYLFGTSRRSADRDQPSAAKPPAAS